MKLYVGVTDNDWYRFLSQLPNVDEVNFWHPGESRLLHRLNSEVAHGGSDSGIGHVKS
jgi:putative restriction endonuclease